MSKEFYYGVAFGLVGLILAVLQMMYPVIPYVIGWPVVAVLGVVAFTCIDIGVRKKEYARGDGVRRQYPLVPKKRLTAHDWSELHNLAEQLEWRHGHEDEQGIEADRLDGYSWSDINNMPCHTCHKPRNEESK